MNKKRIISLIVIVLLVVIGALIIYIDKSKPIVIKENDFIYNEELQQYEAEVDGMLLVTDTLYDGYLNNANELANAYYDRLPAIAQYMLDEDIRDLYGVQTVDELISHLGKPQINISWYVVTYLEHTLDDVHIIDVEFDGNFESFISISING